jgi:hypothetical protein
METLRVCPRCGAYVQPEWPACRICGYDPHNEATHAPIERPTVARERTSFTSILGALATLAVLAVLAFGAVKGAAYIWEHRQGPVAHQEYVAVDR